MRLLSVSICRLLATLVVLSLLSRCAHSQYDVIHEPAQEAGNGSGSGSSSGSWAAGSPASDSDSGSGSSESSSGSMGSDYWSHSMAAPVVPPVVMVMTMAASIEDINADRTGFELRFKDDVAGLCGDRTHTPTHTHAPTECGLDSPHTLTHSLTHATRDAVGIARCRG